MISMDKTLVCRECGREFIFTAGEQEFFASRGLTNEPGRCPECRAARKGASRGGERSRGYGDGSSNDRRDSYGERAPRQMYTVTCSACGREAQVPFQPTSGKPVYCSDCFAQQRGSRY
ncbi:MAG: zinc-ribbon domain containing protein [Chloroflexi bacterium]|nr:zinc-ribbon domain containing protein [Chloroflexota bacterium]